MWNTDPVIVVLCLLALQVIQGLGGLIAVASLRKRYDWAMDGWRRASVLHDETKAQLREAQRNDHRDTKGRYASLEDVCVNPANYPANR